VELGKQLAGKILNELEKNTFVNHDNSTLNLLKHYKNLTN
jgi:glucose-6-phosphate isomerase